MTDLTQKLKNAIKLKESISFSSEKWIAALSKLADQFNIELLWNEEEDNWLKLGDNEKLAIMAAREVPLLFLINNSLLSEFSKIYENEFIYISLEDPDIKMYSVDASEVSLFFPWNTAVVRTDYFSLNDLFYATH